MDNEHVFEDGTAIVLDEDIEVDDFLEADADAELEDGEMGELIAQAESEVGEVTGADEEPEGVEAGE